MSDCCDTENKKEKLMGNITSQKSKIFDDAQKSTLGFLTCPKCGHKQPMEIPTSSCQAFYKCEGCGKTISAEKSCCVFCDYGDRKCPVAEEHQK